MKLGIIADVHADLLSLIAALELLHKRGAEQIVCAGDLVEKGPDGDAVVATVKAKGIPTVRGNHDTQARSNQQWVRLDMPRSAFRNSQASSLRLLKDETLDYVEALPTSLVFTMADAHVVVAHGVPFNDLEYLYPTARRSMFETVVRKARDLDPRVHVLILGHTHAPMVARVLDTWILNPGSVAGLHTSGSNTCGLLSLPECKFEVFDIVTGMRIVPPFLHWPANPPSVPPKQPPSHPIISDL
jgi:putative phosphoesterase